MENNYGGDMRIAIVIGALSGGGAEHFTATFVNELYKREGVIPYLITAEKKQDEYYVNELIDRVCILDDNRNFIKDANVIKKYANNNNIDYVIGIGIYANICVSMGKLLGMKSMAVLSERNDPYHDSISWKSKMLRGILFRFANGYVFQSNGAKEFYSKKIQRNSEVIHNPVINKLPHKSSVNNKEIIAIGRLLPQKNYALLIQSFAEISKIYPEFILRIFGVGDLLDDLVIKTKLLGIENKVHFEGFHKNVHELIKDSFMYVITSDYEGMSNALMESMAMGFPVISTNSPPGGAAELIDDEFNGILTECGNKQMLTEKMMMLIENEELRNNISKNAYDINNTHSVNVIVDKWLKFLNEL